VVFRGYKDVYVDSAFWGIAVIFEFEAVVVVRVLMLGVIIWCHGQRGEAEGGTFEVD
jgi:hypothetical protein